MKKILLLISLSTSLILLQGQGRRSINIEDPSLSTGKKLFESENYKEAIPYFKQALTSTPGDVEILSKLASSYYHLEDYAAAFENYKQLISANADYSKLMYLEAGMAGVYLRKWSEAEIYFKELKSRTGNDATLERIRHRCDYMIYYCRQSKVLLSQPFTMPNPVALSSPINSGEEDYLPMLDATGTKLYFTSKRKGGFSSDGASVKQGDEDLYFTEHNNGSWSSPQLLPSPLNTSGNDGAASFSADGQLMVFGACGREDGVGSCDLYTSTLSGNTWSEPRNMGNVVNSEEWDAHSTLAADGSKIIFSSTRPGGYGGEDLYMIERNPFGEWGVPSNLGPIINTPLSELAPFLSQDGKTLYFSSSGHPGMGSADIFKSVLENGKWSAPVNLGQPLNTAGDDRYFTIGGDGSKGYFSTQHHDVNTIYQIDIPESMRPQPTMIVEGVVTNAKTHETVGAYVMVEDMKTGELIAVNKSNSLTGKYLVVLTAGKSYSVSANKESFFFYSNRFDVPLEAKFTEIKKDIALNPIEKGAKVVLNNIFFETGKATLTLESRLELQKAIDLLKLNASMVIEVGGHTDNVGDDASNMKLSHDRAKSVREYLVNGGIASARVQAKGYGETNPVADNNTDEGRKANRRTEFIILEF